MRQQQIRAVRNNPCEVDYGTGVEFMDIAVLHSCNETLLVHENLLECLKVVNNFTRELPRNSYAEF